jgi:hypothetical protein
MTGLARAIAFRAKQQLTERRSNGKSNGKLAFDQLVTVKVTVELPEKLPNGNEKLVPREVELEGYLFGENEDEIFVMHPEPKHPEKRHYYQHLPRYRGGTSVLGTYPKSSIVYGAGNS